MILKRVSQSVVSSFILWSLCLSTSVQAAGAPDINKLMSELTAPFVDENQIPGTSIAIYYNGQDYFFNYGFADTQKKIPVTKNTIFELASITKIFVTTLLAVEVNEGKINLFDPVVKYLPQLANTKNLPIDNVKVVDLATHTASFPRQMEQFGIKKGNINGFFNRLKTWQPNVPIGSQYKYSNISFGLLGNVLVHSTDKQLAYLLNQKITQPLGMMNTYFTVPQDKTSLQAQGYHPNKTPAPAYVPANFLGGGALRSSAADLLQFMKANLGISVANASPQLLSAMQFAQQPYFTVRPQFVMGLGWQRINKGQNLLITKNGANQGFSTFIGFSPAKKFGVVVLTNQAKSKATLLGNQILKALLKL